MAHCSRPGCRKVEETAGAFLTCSRCNAKAYCSNTCEKADQCSGHGACTVQALQEAAEAGGFTASQYQQVVQFLKQQPPYDPPGTPLTNSSPWFTRPQTALTLAALHALHTALSHPPANPIAPPPALLSSNILPALTAIVPPIPDGAYASVDASCYLILDTLAAVVSAFLSHPLRHMFDPSTPPAAFAPWAPVLKIFTHHHAYSRWLVQGFYQVPDSQVTFMNGAMGGVWSTAGLPGAPPRLAQIFGAEMLLSLGDLCTLCGTLELEMLNVPRDVLCRVWGGVTGSDKVAKMLEQQVVQLPHLGLAQLLAVIADSSEGFSARALLKSPGALRALARPLEALAADPLLCFQELHLHRAHLQSLDKGLAEWIASAPGLPGLRQLCQHLARPTIAALDALLQMSRDDRATAAPTVHDCLVLMTHMAYTADGQSCMTAAGCAPRWLELAPRWKGHPLVLEQLLLLLQVPFQRHSTVYFKELPQGWTALDTSREQRPPLLDKQMGSIVAMDAIAQLVEGVKYDSCLALLMELVRHLLRTRAVTPLPPQLVSALARFCRPPVRPAQGSDRSEIPEMVEFFAKSGLCTHNLQQQALVVLMDHCTALKLREDTAGSQGGGVGAQGKVADVVLDLVVEWLQLCGTKGGIRRSASHLTNEYVRRYQATAYGLLGAALSSGKVPVEVLKKRQVLELWIRTLPPLDDDDELLTTAFLALEAHAPDKAQTGQLYRHMKEVSQQPGCIDAVLAFLGRRVSRLRQGSGQSLHAALGALPGHLALMAVVLAFASSIASGQTSTAGKLLGSTAVWDYFKSMVVEQGWVPVGTTVQMGMVAKWVVLSWGMAKGGELQQQAEAVVRRLGRVTVEQVMQAPWLVADPSISQKIRLDLLLGVFERGSAAGASAAGAPAVTGSCSKAAPPAPPIAASFGACSIGTGPTPAGASRAQPQAADTMQASRSAGSTAAASASTSRSLGADEEAAAKECSV